MHINLFREYEDANGKRLVKGDRVNCKDPETGNIITASIVELYRSTGNIRLFKKGQAPFTVKPNQVTKNNSIEPN